MTKSKDFLHETLLVIDDISTNINDILSNKLLEVLKLANKHIGVNFVCLDIGKFKTETYVLFIVKNGDEYELELYDFGVHFKYMFVTITKGSFDKLYNYDKKTKISLDKLTFYQVNKIINLIQKQMIEFNNK